MPDQKTDWTVIYETRSQTDADLVRTTLEVAGYRVSMEGSSSAASLQLLEPGIMLSVPAKDAEHARQFLREKTSLLSVSSEPSPGPWLEPPDDRTPLTETIEDAATEVLELRGQHEVAACKYCGIATLDVSELDLTSHQLALLRAAGIGVNTATFSEFQAGERICTECAAHEVSCDLCGRTFDAFIDEGDYVRAKDDEAYVCTPCRESLETHLDKDRDW